MLKYVFHISDIHIRNGDEKYCRYREYNDVFNNLHDSLKTKTSELTQDDFVIVVSGDIFHNKNNIGNYGLLLYKTLLEKLTSIGKTIIFHGNHDKNQNDIGQPSLLASTFEIPNLTILDKSTSFAIDDVGFSYVSIDDTLDTYKTCGRIEALPPFPNIEKKVKYKVALFHGTFANVRLYNGTSVLEEHRPYPLEWVKDYDLAILGDIHLRQYGFYDKKTLWGYSGSLIQQNYGEDIIDHGYMIWDIRKKEIEEVNVYNNIGLINVKQEQELSIRIRGKYESLKDYIQNNIIMFPRHVDIKIHSQIDNIKLIKLLSDYNISYNIIGIDTRIESLQNISEETHENHQTHYDDEILIDKNTMMKHFHKHLSEEQHAIFSEILKNNEYLLFDINKYPEELHNECHKKNKELSTMINNCTKSDDKKTYRPPFKIQYLEWSNLYCYENKNYINFESTYRNTFLISGNNGTGKSAIYDILVLAIWGEITTNKQNPISAGIINHKHDNAYTIIDIVCDNHVYRIKRNFSSLSNKHTLNKQRILFYKDNVLFKKDNACNEEILKISGTIDEFLASSMITQNVDYDILKMNYKDCLSMIDKATNIDYIYNLYSLFKGCINKYRDLYKVVESKKQVYEKLMHGSTNIKTLDLCCLKSELEKLVCIRKELIRENNNIAVNLNDPVNEIILATDYDTDNTGNTNVDVDIDINQYRKLKIQYNELSILFKDYHEKDIIKLCDMYHDNDYDNHNDDIYEKHDIIVKPCELSFIEEQEALLQQYQGYTPILNNSYSQYQKDINKLTSIYDELQQDQHKLITYIQEINDMKPITTTKPSTDEKTIYQIINDNYSSVEKLKEFCENNQSILTNNEDVSSMSSLTPLKIQYNLESYNKTVKNMTVYNKKMAKAKENISKLEKDIREILNNKNKLVPISKPSEDIQMYNIEKIKNILDEIGDISDIMKQITENNEIIEKYTDRLDDIFALEKKKEEFVVELHHLQTTDEYQYDPSCKYCCTRSWVYRISELERLIHNHSVLIDDFYFNNDIEHLTLISNNEEMMAIIKKQELCNKWLAYLEYANKYDSITTLYDCKTNEMNTLISDVAGIEQKMKNTQKIQFIFNKQSHNLYQIYNHHIAYNKYKNWKDSYDDATHKKNNNETNIENIKEYMTFVTEIRPRLQNLAELKEKYKVWKEYDDRVKVKNAKEYYRIKNIINIYEKKQEFERNKERKSKLIEKMAIAERLTQLEIDIQEHRDVITKYEANAIYNEKNEESYKRLCESLVHIDKVLDVMDVIIAKFKHYRKDIYDNYVMKNLIKKANKYIQTLCHTDTKTFTLDYIITEVKDILHINWLVKTETIETKQLISVHQASGFQRFVISLALRMSLFSNKTCKQLFFDEGFTACDKQNLSIVPTFLKGLLNVFDSVIIVSHIDIIQDNTDMITHIKYDKNTKTSSIKYGKYNDNLDSQ